MKNRKDNIHPIYSKYLYRYNKSMTLACDDFKMAFDPHYHWINENSIGGWHVKSAVVDNKSITTLLLEKSELYFEFESDAVKYKLTWLGS